MFFYCILNSEFHSATFPRNSSIKWHHYFIMHDSKHLHRPSYHNQFKYVSFIDIPDMS